jgi:hypothetical protein
VRAFIGHVRHVRDAVARIRGGSSRQQRLSVAAVPRRNGQALKGTDQGCQMVSVQTKNPNLGKFWRALGGKMLVYFRAVWNIFWIFYDHLVHFVFVWYIFPVLVSCTSKNLATLGRTENWSSYCNAFINNQPNGPIFAPFIKSVPAHLID